MRPVRLVMYSMYSGLWYLALLGVANISLKRLKYFSIWYFKMYF